MDTANETLLLLPEVGTDTANETLLLLLEVGTETGGTRSWTRWAW